MFANMATSLFEHKKLHTTQAKAKELRPFAESLITKAKVALSKEKQKALPEGQNIDIHNRRLVARYIRNKAVLQELFDAIAPVVESRNGGYTRITKTGFRRGDASNTAIIELVDWSAPVDGAINLKKKKKKQITKQITTTKSKKIENEEVLVEKIESKNDKKDIIDNVEIVDNIQNVATNNVETTIEPETILENNSNIPIESNDPIVTRISEPIKAESLSTDLEVHSDSLDKESIEN